MTAKYKEPWEMTKKQYMAFREEGVDWKNTRSGPGEWGKKKWRQRSVELHRESIRKALVRGRRVPSVVLRGYPDLRALSGTITIGR